MAKEYSEIFLEEFLELAKEKDYTKISIVDLTEHCSASRQAFYYHYNSIEDMIEKAINRDIDGICARIGPSSTRSDASKNFLLVLEKYQPVIKSALNSKNCMHALELISTNIDKYVRVFVKVKREETRFSDFLYTCCKYTFTGLIADELRKDNPNLINILNKIDETLIQ